ncbi:MAG: hypothetical protein HKN29_04495 [Rhodothermales bacterium]|nr:hypothetical protein [Rhodothermales bacterium]
MSKPDPPKPSSRYLRYASWFLPAALLTWGAHEGAHWIMGTALGYDMWITINQVGLTSGSYSSSADQFMVSMAGPLITWAQGGIALWLALRLKDLAVYPFLFLAVWMRALAWAMSHLSNPNDEAVAGLLIGLPMWILPALSVSLLAYLTVRGSRATGAGWKENAVAYVLASLSSAVVVLSDSWLFG